MRSVIMPRPGGEHFGIARSVRLSVTWRSCLGYRHAGCLQLSRRRAPEMCGLRTRPRTDVDPPRFLDRTAIGGGGAYRLAAPGAIPWPYRFCVKCQGVRVRVGATAPCGATAEMLIAAMSLGRWLRLDMERDVSNMRPTNSHYGPFALSSPPAKTRPSLHFPSQHSL